MLDTIFEVILNIHGTKKEETTELIKGSMHGYKERGLDYTPLFKFLLSKVGDYWDDVFSEVNSRLDKTEPIYWIVALNEKEGYGRVGELSYFSGLYVGAEKNYN